MQAALNRLLAWIGASANAPIQVERLGAALLQSAPDAQSPERRSTLNNDGSPLQVCATYGARGRKLRLIGDPSAGQTEAVRRLAAAHAALDETLALSGAKALSELCRESLVRLLPRDARHPELDAGAIWLACGLDGGAAMYVNARWGCEADRWRDAAGWLADLLPARNVARRAIDAVRPHATLASFALEGTSPANARVKLYWRLTRPTPLSDLGLPLLQHANCGAFLTRLVGERTLPASGLVLSAGFAVADGELSDVKIDLCAHCLPRPAAAWVTLLEDCCGAFGLAPFDLADGMLENRGEVAFVGFGLDGDGGPRLNLYLKPESAVH